MMTNQATWERILRIAAGAIALGLGYFGSGLPTYGSLLLMGVGIVLIATGLVAYCPVWHMLGISTKNKDSDRGLSKQ